MFHKKRVSQGTHTHTHNQIFEEEDINKCSQLMNEGKYSGSDENEIW